MALVKASRIVPLKLSPEDFSDSDRKRFWSKVEIHGLDDCWEWTAGKDKDGYGKFSFQDDHHVLAHRVAYALVTGQTILDGTSILHTCDNPPCCNGRHLFEGSESDNTLDAIRKGRKGGERHGMAKLTRKQVVAIRRDYKRGYGPHDLGNGTKLASKYGVSKSLIVQIVRRVVWKQV